MVVGRFAPSPSGRLHLGNLFCCLLAWLSAHQQGGRVVLRVEDLDTARCPRRYALQAMEDLRWLGLTWDEAVRTAPTFKVNGRRFTRWRFKSWRAWGWCTPAFAPGRSCTLPVLLTGETGRSSTGAPAGI